MLQCHGQRVETAALEWVQKLAKGKDGELATREDPLKDYLSSQIKTHLNSLYRWGVLLDQKHISLSVEPDYIDACLDALQKLVAKNKVRLDHKPIFWSTKLQRAIPPSEIEVDEVIDKHHFVEFILKQEDLAGSSEETKSHLSQLYPDLRFLVQVDQVWKLAGIKAVTVHPTRGYTVFKNGDKIYIMSSRGLDSEGAQMFHHGKINKITSHIGQDLIGATLIDPITGKELPIIGNTEIEDSISHILPLCPSTNPADFRFSEKLEVDRSPCVDFNGKLLTSNPKLAGLSLFQTATEGMLLELASKGQVLQYTNESPMIWFRHKQLKDPVFLT